MDKLQVHILNDYSGSLRRNNGVDTFIPMISFRENIIHPYIEDVLENQFTVAWKVHYIIDGKLKTFNKSGDPILKNNPKYKNNQNCKGIGMMFDHIVKIYSGIKNCKSVLIVLSDNIWCTTPDELSDFYNDISLDTDFLLMNVNLNQDVRLTENKLFEKVSMHHINLVDSGYDEEFEKQLNEFLKI